MDEAVGGTGVDGVTSGEGEVLDPRVEAALEAAKGHREAGRLDEAAAVLREALEELPEEPELHEAVGAVLGDAGRRGEAIAAWSEALRLRPESERARLILSFWLKKEESLDDAIAVLREGLDRCPSRRSLWLKELSRLYDFTEQPTRALNLYNELLEARPDDAEVLRLRSDLLRKTRGSGRRR